MITETLTWRPVAEKPDSDLSVLLFDPAASVPVWPGYLDGEIWRYADGMTATPTYWAKVPFGPNKEDYESRPDLSCGSRISEI